MALKSSQGNFDSTMFISDEMRSELKWWIDNLATQKRHGNANVTITTDASSCGWGAICKGVGCRWNDQESQFYINYLELLAVSHALKIFCKSAENIHVQIKTDNSCTVSYLNKMCGVRSEECNSLAKQIWKWCINRSIWLSASHIPGIENENDFESRNFKDNVEWKLNSRIFHTITEIWGHPDVDMFASRLNKQVDRFVSWHPDPDCIAVDAFSLTWSNELIYAFPPFSLIGRLVQKLRQDQGEMVLVAPVWLTQGWFTAVMELLIDLPRIFKVQQDTLSLTYSDRIHPLTRIPRNAVSRLPALFHKIEVNL